MFATKNGTKIVRGLVAVVQNTKTPSFCRLPSTSFAPPATRLLSTAPPKIVPATNRKENGNLPTKETLLRIDWLLEKVAPLVLKSHVRNFIDICKEDVQLEDRLFNYKVSSRSALMTHIAKIRLYYRYLSPFNKVEWIGSCVYENEDVVVVLWRLQTLESSFLSYFPSFITKKEQKLITREGALDVHVDSAGNVYKIVNRAITASDREGAKALAKIKATQESARQKEEEKEMRKEFDRQFVYKLQEKRFVVQNDWNVVLRDAVANFFIGIREPNSEKTSFFDVQSTKMIDELSFTVFQRHSNTGEPDLSLKVDEKNNLVIKHGDHFTKFIPPISEMEIPGLQSAPHSIDVTTSSNFSYIAADSSGNFVNSMVVDRTKTLPLKGHAMDVYKCRFFPSGSVALSAGMDMTVRIWAIDNGNCARTLKGHKLAVTDICVLGVGKNVLSCSNDGSVIKWNCGSSEIVQKWDFHLGKCTGLALSKDEQFFAVICDAKNLVVCPLDDGNKSVIKLPSEPKAVCFSAGTSDSLVFVGFDSGVAVYNSGDGSCLAQLSSSRGAVTCLRSNGQHLLVAHNDGTIAAYRIPLLSDFNTNFSVFCPEFELSGPDCDPVYDFTIVDEKLYSCCRDKIGMNTSFLRSTSLASNQIRQKTVKFKPKIARTHQLKTPSILALDHFDFYYGPLFGKKWPSIRLGLLSSNRYVAVMNTMSKNWRAHDEILSDLGTIDVLQKIRGGTAEERVDAMRRRIGESSQREADELRKDFASTSGEQKPPSRTEDFEEDLEMRTAAGLGEFRGSRGELTTADLQLNQGPAKKSFEITGYEGASVRIPKREHFIEYPKNLHIRCFDRAVLMDFPSPMKDEAGVPSYWLLDGGSLIPVLALGLQQDDSVLDVCAAPGGKSLLTILSRLPRKVVCNDFKLTRLGQLQRALNTYVPDDEVADTVRLKRKNAGDLEMWDELNAYDKVLADVPCSTDRLSASTDVGNIFSPATTQQRLDLPLLQTKILVNSLRAAKIGGSVVYSTCTLSPSQNEAVVQNAVGVAKQQYGIEVVEESLNQLTGHLTSSGLFRFHDTTVGALVIPFLPSNFGPMYVCKLTRLQ
ncbi:unnamed protein product [Caenorhabditis auriculariae]|uniref:NOL1/NOP2/Sun domain family member 4 n=1 Tax=Caenorhabditis auriculariae TaxID=2777116 RepID=A0A8S1HQA7_9PELO|nr:unnamed protein product [Caenorhabditis auriculariae]